MKSPELKNDLFSNYFGIANQTEKQIENAEARVLKLTQDILIKAFRSE